MRRRDLIIFFILEIFAILWAAVLFANFPPKPSGVLAGAYFVVSGLYMLNRARRWPQKWKSLTWYALFIHVFAVSLPMLGTRLMHWSEDFTDIRIFGIPGPAFHTLSTTVFSALMAATAIEFIIETKSRPPAPVLSKN